MFCIPNTDRFIRCSFLFLLGFILSGCVLVKTEPIRVDPIYIEITINHKIQRELDSLFADLDQASETTRYEPLESKE